MKIKCSKCGLYKDCEDFYNDYRRKIGKQSQCKKCFYTTQLKYRNKNIKKVRLTLKKWYTNNRERIKLENQQKIKNDKNYHRRRELMSRHGLTLNEYDKLVKIQNNKCAICGDKELCKNGYLLIDHDHTCCEYRYSCNKCRRGLLCNHCNRGLGAFKDNMELLNKAINYLKCNKNKI